MFNLIAMASKRISKHTVDFIKMIDVMNPWEKARLHKFKAVADAYARK